MRKQSFIVGFNPNVASTKAKEMCIRKCQVTDDLYKRNKTVIRKKKLN
jgi:hypothetical protein